MKTTQMDMNAVRANISGRVTEICVSPYQQVKKGDTVIVLEALKMRIPQVAPCDCMLSKFWFMWMILCRRARCWRLYSSTDRKFRR